MRIVGFTMPLGIAIAGCGGDAFDGGGGDGCDDVMGVYAGGSSGPEDDMLSMCRWCRTYSSVHLHFLRSSGSRKSMRHPVSFCIFLRIDRISSCSLKSVRHSAPMLIQRMPALATPLEEY